MGDINKKHDTGTLVKVGMAAGAIGAAAGAIAVSMSDKKNRQKVTSQIDKMKNWSDKAVREVKKDLEASKNDATEQTEKALEDIEDKAEKLTKEAKEKREQVQRSL